jgi:predicted DNA-binding antitoxin AbrB/MazE fold protein
MQRITATFEDGVLKPEQPLNLPTHAQVSLTIEMVKAPALTVERLNEFLQGLPVLDDADDFAQDIRAIRAEFPAEANPCD